MRFDNAFLCKSGHVGIQFRTRSNKGSVATERSEGAIISIFHDGKHLRVSEEASPPEQAEALRKYHFLHKRFKSN